VYGSDPFACDFEGALSASTGTRTTPRLKQAERQARWEAGLSLDGSKLDPVVARYLARRGARPDMSDVRVESPVVEGVAGVVHEVVHHETHTSIPTLPVSARQLERHRRLYGREGTESVEISEEGLDQRERPLPADWKLRAARIRKRDKNTCQRCTRRLGARQLSVHHIIPRAEGGPDSDANLITLCTVSRKENGGLSCHDWVEVRIDRGKLAKNATAIRASWAT
jgi:HNH endonuclease